MSLKDRLNTQQKPITPKGVNVQVKAPVEAPKTTPNNDEGFGILEAFFVDKNTNSVYVTGAKNIFIEQRGVIRRSATAFKDNSQLIEIIKKNAFESKETNSDGCFIKFNYKRGFNVCATLPPVSNVPVLYIKSYHDENANLKSLQENKIVSKEIAMILEALATTRANILIVGNQHSLKTTILSAFSKLIQPNFTGIIADFKNEFKIKAENFVNYDFIGLDNEDEKSEIFSSLFNINPDRIIINSPDENSIKTIVKRAILGSKGITLTLEFDSAEDAIKNLSGIILKQNPALSIEEAKSSIIKAFDLIILCNKDDSGLRAITKISELNSKENAIKDIFYLNSNAEHSSTGYIPEFYNSLKANYLSLNSNIFDENYRHTYSQMASSSNFSNNELMKKTSDNSKDETEQQVQELDISLIQKRVQERFEELKKNVKLSENKQEAQVSLIETQDIQTQGQDELNQNE